jgi:hypothetical protein
MTQDQIWDQLEIEVTALVRALIPTIGEEYRATEEDESPSMLITVGADESGAWSYQTGDNSYTGGAYSFPVWGLGYLYRDSDPAEVARGIVDEIAEQLTA